MRRIFFALLLLLFFNQGVAQAPANFQLSEKAEISLLTCGPGTELYSQFGHNAFRVKDPLYGIDVVYNYGTFDFDTPYFYAKFARGKLLYQLSRSKFERFLYTYQYENRWIKEQILNIDQEAKQELFQFLEINLKPENRSYKYDFFFNNCATKMRTVLQEVMDGKVNFDDTVETPMTFRAIIHQYVQHNSWSGFGIDLALGAVIDRETTAKERFFIPDYVFEGYADANLRNRAENKVELVEKTATIYEPAVKENKSFFLTSPLVIFCLLMIVILWVTYKDNKTGKRSTWLDIILFLTTGLAGLVILFLWFGTDHSATALNLNVLWAFAPNLFVAFLLKRNKKWFVGYMNLLIVLVLLVVLIWAIGSQIFPLMSIPILVALVVRYGYLRSFYKRSLSTSEK
ncbi:DUF4105 domain-containing protein [Sungkyunkwania multivorans]|uniref:DUF4105 domain-containing protein n=1 Tax=Sungkyunkwania multivorans TaxID=1173618 RepID=A0ABW3D6E0_9FLAO